MKKQPHWKTSAQEEGDIIDLIHEDHWPLKELVKVMKDTKQYDLEKRRDAFEDFAPMYIIHTKPEEQSLYSFMKDCEVLKHYAYKGSVEHQLVEHMLNEIIQTENEDLWSARVKILAEMVEHHIEEEEEEMFPELRKNSGLEERAKLGTLYMQLKTQFDAEGNFRPINQVSDVYIEHHMHH